MDNFLTQLIFVFENSGFKGPTCNINVNECGALPCSHGSCIDGINSYTCNCTGSGYTGQTCAEDINECETNNPCHPNATCTNYPGTYQCSCQPGFTGKNCYENVDDCRSNPCRNGGESHANQILCCTLLDFDELLPLVLTGTHPGSFYCYQKKGVILWGIITSYKRGTILRMVQGSHSLEKSLNFLQL